MFGTELFFLSVGEGGHVCQVYAWVMSFLMDVMLGDSVVIMVENHRRRRKKLYETDEG